MPKIFEIIKGISDSIFIFFHQVRITMMIGQKYKSSPIKMLINRTNKFSQDILFVHIHHDMFCYNEIIFFGNFKISKGAFMKIDTWMRFKIIWIMISD